MLADLSRRVAAGAAALALVLALVPAQPAAAAHGVISGTVTDAVSGAVLEGVCVTLGPPIRCWTHTNASGFYQIVLEGANDGGKWELYFLKTGYLQAHSGIFVVNGPYTHNQAMTPTGAPTGCAPGSTATPVSTNFLPNITKTLGGASGFQTPFITQNTGTLGTTLEISWFKFSDGTCVKRINVPGLAPGTSFAHIPNNDADLPGDSQFSVVIKSFNSTIVSVVNQHQGSGSRAEAASYVGFSTGATTVSLPNIVRRFFGYVSPFIMQNLGANTTTAVATFRPFDGGPAVTASRSITAGRSQFIDPNSEPGLVDGKQYAVTVSASEPLGVVVNTHNDAPTVAAPVFYSANGVSGGSGTIYGPYAAKNANNSGRTGTVATIVVQNVGGAAVTPTLRFTPLAMNTTQTFSGPSVAPGSAWAFDPRFENGVAGAALCGGAATASCLGDGEYAFVATATGSIAAAVNVISPATAMGYAASAAPSAKVHLPNVTRTLGGAAGWSTPILLQGVTATGATLKWFRFSDGSLTTTQTVGGIASTAVRIDPRDVGGLSEDTQYAVVIEGSGGTVNAIVIELADGGDNAMIYEGFPAP
ncbi:MAG: hypothetical protein ACRDM7_17485 [Thermoleophilaceae bacterium]